MSKLNNWFIDINEYKYNKLDNNGYLDIHYYQYKYGFGFGRGVDCGHGDLNGEGDEEIYNNGYLTGKGYGRGSGNGQYCTGYGYGGGSGTLNGICVG